ncbi:MAG: SCO family protein [Chloroflexota bacterium]
MQRLNVWSICVGLFFVAMVATGCQALGLGSVSYKGTQLNPPRDIPEFELVDTTGSPFHFSDLEGDIALFYFGYTFCPDVCPLTMWDVSSALKDLEGQEQVKVVFVSVDPDRDTPEVIDRYVSSFGDNFIGVTGDEDQLDAAKKPFGVFSQKEETEDSAADYLVSHTSRIFLVDPNGDVILNYSFGFEPDDLRSDLELLLAQK